MHHVAVKFLRRKNLNFLFRCQLLTRWAVFGWRIFARGKWYMILQKYLKKLSESRGFRFFLVETHHVCHLVSWKLLLLGWDSIELSFKKIWLAERWTPSFVYHLRVTAVTLVALYILRDLARSWCCDHSSSWSKVVNCSWVWFTAAEILRCGWC